MKRKKKLVAKVWDRTWAYTPSHATDIRVRFDAIRKQLAEANKQQVAVNVRAIKRKVA